MNYEHIKEELQALLEGEVTTNELDRERLARDTSLFYVRPELVVFPKSSRDLEKLLRYVSEMKKKGMKISVSMRSAGTCMTGGSLTSSIIVDTTKFMNHIEEVTDEWGRAESGVYYRDYEKETLKHGWLMPSYPASRELVAIGGMVSNNCGGEKTLTYGKSEKYIKELEVVFANGDTDIIRELNEEELKKKMEENTESGRIHREIFALIDANYDAIAHAKPTVTKNSSGYYLWNVYNKDAKTFNLCRLIAGSQGTLAAVAKATFTGVKPKTHSRMLVIFVPSTTGLGEIIPRLLTHKPETLESYDDHTFKIAIKFFKDIAVRMGGNMITLGLQFLPEFWMAVTGGVPKIILMAEFKGDSDDEVTKMVNTAMLDMQSFGLQMKKTNSEQEAKKYWTFRRESFNLLRQRMKGLRTAPTIDDIIVHATDLPEFLPKLEKIFSNYDLTYTVAGHMGDANFHIIPLVDIHQPGIVDTLHRLMDEVFTLVYEYKGSMSGEHNDGLLRTSYLPKMFSGEVITWFEKTKDIFDPEGVLNPGKKVHGDSTYAWSHIDTK